MSYNLKTPEDVVRTIKDDKIQMIDLRFTDLPGLWQHFSVPPTAFDLKSFEGGGGFDGSSIPWFQAIQESDILVIPDTASAFLDPFTEMPTLVLICNIRDLATGQSYTRDPRSIAQKAEAYLQTTQIGDTANFGLELEHFMFAGPRNDQSTNYDGCEFGTTEANSSTARRYPVPPADVLQDIRKQIVATLEMMGVEVEAHHHGVATSGQDEINMRFATLTRMADNLMIYKYVVENVARQRGMVATFISSDGSGMHVHQSIWLGERSLFAGDGYGGTSALMRHYVAGLADHAPALLAICALMANSCRTLVPRFEVPVNLGYPLRNRYSPNPEAKHVEFRCPNPSCNPYLAFAAMLMAGIDGFHNRLYNLDPDEPIENLYDQPPQEPAKGRSAPGWLDALEADHAFLLQGEVFTPDVIETHL